MNHLLILSLYSLPTLLVALLALFGNTPQPDSSPFDRLTPAHQTASDNGLEDSADQMRVIDRF